MRHELIMESCQGMGEAALLDYISIAMANGHSKEKILENLKEDYTMLAPEFRYEWIKPLIEKFDGSYSTEPRVRNYSVTNRRVLKTVVINGEEIGLHKLSKETGIQYTTLYRRYKKGIRDDSIIINTNPKKGRPTIYMVEIDGEEISLKYLSKETGISYTTLKNRYLAGARGKEILKRRRKKDGNSKSPKPLHNKINGVNRSYKSNDTEPKTL
jgi:hypothetical protein